MTVRHPKLPHFPEELLEELQAPDSDETENVDVNAGGPIEKPIIQLTPEEYTELKENLERERLAIKNLKIL